MRTLNLNRINTFYFYFVFDDIKSMFMDRLELIFMDVGLFFLKKIYTK